MDRMSDAGADGYSDGLSFSYILSQGHSYQGQVYAAVSSGCHVHHRNADISVLADPGYYRIGLLQLDTDMLCRLLADEEEGAGGRCQGDECVSM